MASHEVVGRADQKHASTQQRLPRGQRAGAPRERGQTGAEGGVQPLDVRRVDLMRAATGRGQHLRHGRRAAQDDAAGDTHDMALGVALHDLRYAAAPAGRPAAAGPACRWARAH